jgi:hypothetical protein
MAKFEFQGLDEYLKVLADLGDKSEGLIKRAVYDGAAEVAKAVEAEIRALTENDGFQVRLPIRGVSKEQKRGLLEGMGFAKMENENGFINTKLGFDGYNEVKTKQFPKGQPNAMIARSINSGSSTRKKDPFMNRAVKAAKEKAENAMAARLDADIATIIKE